MRELIAAASRRFAAVLPAHAAADFLDGDGRQRRLFGRFPDDRDGSRTRKQAKARERTREMRRRIRGDNR